MREASNVLWIGGPAGAGKTTAARQLARRHGLRWYSGDTRTWEHRDRALAAGIELPSRGPGQAYYDRRPMILDDVRSMPAAPLIVAEGGQITPSMVEPGHPAVWLLPSKDAQLTRLRQRHPDGVPPAYAASWDSAAAMLEDASVMTLDVGDLTVEATVDELERIFASRLTDGPKAGTPRERRHLIREGNLALVAQYTSPTARPLNPAPPDQVVRTFDCECAAAGCTAVLDIAVGDIVAVIGNDPPAVLAPGHHG